MAEEYGPSYPQDRVDWISGINLEALRKGRLQRAKEALFEENDFRGLPEPERMEHPLHYLHLHPALDHRQLGLAHAMLCRDADQPILYEQGDIGYHTRRLAPWLGDENVKYAITGMGWISRTMGERAHEQQVASSWTRSSRTSSGTASGTRCWPRTSTTPS